MKLYKRYINEHQKRVPFADVSIASQPFQLLPKVCYPASKLEATLSWQQHFAENTTGFPKFSIIVFAVAEDPEAIIGLLESIGVQSYLNYEVILVACGQIDKITEYEGLYQRFGFSGSILYDE